MTGNLINIDTSVVQNTGNSIKGMFSVVSNWDFTIFKWVIIAVLILIPIVIIFLLLSGKVCLFNTGFGEGYGLRLITGEFGSGKTKNVFQSAFLRKKANPNGILISNLKYDFVDFYFNSKKDFDFLLRDLVRYIHDTNNLDELKKSIEFPPIKIIVDEAHLYLFARDFKGFTKDILLVLTQCRKRDISVDFITQELGQIDVFIRRLCPYIEYFQKLPLGLTKQSILYSLDVEGTSMKNEEMFEEVESSWLLPFSRGPIFNKKVKEYYDQKYLTKFVIGYEDVRYTDEDKDESVSKRYPEFKEKMLKNLEEFRKPKIKKMGLFDKFLNIINHRANNKFNDHLIDSRIRFCSSYINDFKSYLGDEKFSSILNNAGFTSVTSESDSKLNILNTQEKMIDLLVDSVSESDLNIINHYKEYKNNQFNKFKWFLVDKLFERKKIPLCCDEWEVDFSDEMYSLLFKSPDGKIFENGQLDEMYNYIIYNKFYLSIPDDELSKYSEFLPKSEDNIQTPKTI